MKQYNVSTRNVPARSRNKRDLVANGGSSVNVTIQGGNGSVIDPNSHTHRNKALLDSLYEEALYLYLRVMEEGASESVLKKIKAGFADLAQDLSDDSPVWDKVLRKDQPDQTAHLLSLLAGVIVKGAVARLDDGAQFGESFADGLTGHGGRIDGKGYGELRGLRLWEWLEVPEFRYNCVKVFVGIDWQVAGAGIVESVTVDLDQQGKPLSTGTVKLKLEQGQYGAIDVDDIAMGIYHFGDERDATADKDDSKGNFAFAGFATSYFRVTSVGGAHNETFKYALRPGYSVHPQPMMHFACFGNFSNKDRQTSTYRTRSYTRRLWKQNTWEIAIDNIAAQDGDLTNLNIHGMQMDGYSAYLNNIYFSGTIQSLKKPDGTAIQLANDRGAWKSGEYNYYDRVSHNGSLWLCVNDKGTTSEPSSSSPDWLKQVSKGSDGADLINHGPWKSGMKVSNNGLVTMGGKAFLSRKETTNPPLWTYTDEQGNSYTTTDGYVLTGEMNEADYTLIAENGADGKPGQDGKPGRDGYQGCIMRTSEFALNTQYRNDTDDEKYGSLPVRYVDFVMRSSPQTATGWRVFRCVTGLDNFVATKTPETDPANWTEVDANMSSIYTSFLLAKNATIKFLAGSRMVSLDNSGNPIAGMSGDDICFWAGNTNPGMAPFQVSKAGSLKATNATITGTIYANSGKIGGFTIEAGRLNWKQNDYFGSDARSVKIGISNDEFEGCVDVSFNGSLDGRYGLKVVGSNRGGACLYASTGVSTSHPNSNNTYAAYLCGAVDVLDSNVGLAADVVMAKKFRVLINRQADGRYEYHEGVNWNKTVGSPNLDSIRLIVENGIITGYYNE